jgi:hypothetical protein
LECGSVGLWSGGAYYDVKYGDVPVEKVVVG